MRLYVLNETWVVGCNFGKPTRCWSNLDYHRMFLMLQQVVWLLKHLKPSNRIEKSNRMLCNCVVARLVMYCTSHFGNHPDSIITICSRKLVKFRHETPSMWNTAAICSHQSIPSPVALVDQLSTLASCEHFRQFARSLDQIFWTFGSVQNWGDEALSSTSQSKENRHYMDVYLKIIWKKTWKKTFSPKFIIMFPFGHFTWEPCPLDIPWPTGAFLSHVLTNDVSSCHRSEGLRRWRWDHRWPVLQGRIVPRSLVLSQSSWWYLLKPMAKTRCHLFDGGYLYHSFP